MKATELNDLQRSVKACPFCSGSAKLGPMPGAASWWRVRCEWHHCGGTTWAIQGPQDAVTAWNRRTADVQA